MARHKTFRYCLDPTVDQLAILGRHAGASRLLSTSVFRCSTSRRSRRVGRIPAVTCRGLGLTSSERSMSGRSPRTRGGCLSWTAAEGLSAKPRDLRGGAKCVSKCSRRQPVDCGRVLAAWSQSRSGKRRGKRVGFPKFKKKSRTLPSFRLRNRHPKQGKPLIRVGESHPRSVTLPSIGAVRVHNDTRSLRRLTRAGAKIVYGTVSDRAGHWWLALNVDTPDLHPAHRHSEQCSAGEDSWVGVDVGLTSFLVAATVDGIEVARIDQPPKPLSTGIRRQRFLAKSLSRKEINSNHRRKAAARLARHHNRIRNIRSHSFMKSRTIWSRPTTVSC